MKTYKIYVDLTETQWVGCIASVPANSLEEAIKEFNEDPWSYDWEWEDVYDSQIESYEINMKDTEKNNA